MASIKSTVQRLDAVTDLQRQIVHGDENTTVITDSGPQPTLRKELKDAKTSAYADLIASSAGAVGTSVTQMLERISALEAAINVGVTPSPVLTVLGKTDIAINGLFSAITGATYQLYSQSGLLLETTGTSWTLNATHGILPETTYSLYAVAIVNGIPSAASGTVAITTDATAATVPDAPTITLFGTPDYESGQVTVTGETGAAITVYVDGVQYATGTSGDTFTITGLTQSTGYAVTATQTVSGETSAVSSSVTLNTTAVPVPTFTTSNVTADSITGSFSGFIGSATITGTINGDAFSTSVAEMNFTGLTAETAYTIEFTQTVGGQASASASIVVTTLEATPTIPANAVYFNSEPVTHNGLYVTY